MACGSMLLAMAFCWTRWARLWMCVVLRVGKLIEFYHIWYFGSYCRSGFDGLGIQNEKSALLLSSLHVSVVECRHEPFLLVLEFFPGCGALLFGQIFVRLVLGDRTNDKHQVTLCSVTVVHTWFSSNESWSWYFQMSLGLFCISSASKRSFGTAGVGLAD